MNHERESLSLRKSSHTVTVLFEPPFWVVLFEKEKGGKYSVARIVLGTSEPGTAELMQFFKQLDFGQLDYTVPVENDIIPVKSDNFKRRQRQARKETAQCAYKHTYSKSHQAIKAQQEQKKTDKKKRIKREKEEDAQRKFEIRQWKKKQKMKGK